MEIVLLIDDYLPSTKSAPLMIHQLALGLLRRGDRPAIMTPSADIAEDFVMDSSSGFKVIRFRSGRLKNVNRIRRAVNELLLPFRVLRVIGKIPEIRSCDLLVYYSPSIFWGAAVGRLKKRFRCPSYLILRDIFPQWCIDNGILRAHSPATAFFRFFERINYRAADRIGIQSKGNLKYFDAFPELRDKIEILPNWFDGAETLPPPGGWRGRLGLEGKLVFFYGGNLGNAQDMANLARLARNMRSCPQAHFLLAGKGDEYELLERLKQEWWLDNLTLTGVLEQQEYFSLLQEVDVGLISLHPLHKTHNFPGKLLGYMACSKPVLGSVNAGNDIIGLFNETGAGLMSVNPDDDRLLENARKLLDPEFRQAMGRRSRELLLKRFSVNAIAAQICGSVRADG